MTLSAARTADNGGQIAKKIKSAWQRFGFKELTMTDDGWIMVAPDIGVGAR
ncbi:hypothetical protein NE236_10030 [Actinoallomurus purpureus]|uniref:hypothetical protein n=1 Tax=Actinoallomurus purpureus TaxID=478114 RepID=UPI002091F874|nr:hypothetical protein [Actinoallomurus purpureus]MCO6005322.1 hypothetical protein [Actinoallomurus purpureus]